MPVDNYGVLRVIPTAFDAVQVHDTKFHNSNTIRYSHLWVQASAGGVNNRLVINVWSAPVGQQPNRVLFAQKAIPANHPWVAALTAVPAGFTALAAKNSVPAIDLFQVQPLLVTQGDFAPLQYTPGTNVLAGPLTAAFQAAMNANSTVWVLGSGFADGGPPGIHNAHQNQGNIYLEEDENDPWQDGGVVFQNADGSVTGFFFAFETQDSSPAQDGKPSSYVNWLGASLH